MSQQRIPRTAVIGAGAFGTALARHLARAGEPVVLWARSEALAEQLRTTRSNSRYLPEGELPPSVEIEIDLAAAVGSARCTVLATPAQFLRGVALQLAPYLSRDALVVCAAKGIEADSLATLDVVLAEALPDHPAASFAYLSGPSFAAELALGVPTALVVASQPASSAWPVVPSVLTPPGPGEGLSAARQAQSLLSRERLRVYRTDDVRGVLVGGALKNVIALAVGAADGLGLGHNARAALVTRGLAEMGRLATRLGGEARTLSGLAGLGDLVLTCNGPLSRNRHVGVELGRGRPLESVLSQMRSVVEGVETCRAASQLAARLGVSMPIVEQVFHVLFEGRSVSDALDQLLSREIKDEQDDGWI